MSKNIIVYVSSRNNYDMLAGEVLKNIKLNGCEFINIDDKSDDAEIVKGKKICHEQSIVFLENKSRGVQWATQTLVDFIHEHRPECKWIFCFQHDNYPITENFFSRIDTLIKNGSLEQFGALGFNVLDDGRYTGDALKKWENKEEPLGMLGLCHLSEHDASKRWLCPSQQGRVLSKKHARFRNPFIIEIPMWAAVGINIQAWERSVTPTTDYQFHLWFPDVMMQLNKANYPCLILPKLYCINRQDLKRKYDIPVNSAQAAKKGDSYHFGEYGPHLENFKKRWGWDYEDVENTYEKVRDQYKDLIFEQYYTHRIRRGPLKSFDFGEY